MYFSYVQMDFIWRINLRKSKSIPWILLDMSVMGLMKIMYRYDFSINPNSIYWGENYDFHFRFCSIYMLIRCHQGYHIYSMRYLWEQRISLIRPVYCVDYDLNTENDGIDLNLLFALKQPKCDIIRYVSGDFKAPFGRNICRIAVIVYYSWVSKEQFCSQFYRGEAE